MKKRKQHSSKEKARRDEQSFKDKSGIFLKDGEGGFIKATPIDKGRGYRLK